ncbi:hypothetical protein ACFL54_09865 [Planctomycetota bacterium]
MDRLEDESQSFFDDGIEILGLTQRAAAIFLRRKPAEKRKLLNVIASDFIVNGTTLEPKWNKPFNWIAEGLDIGEMGAWRDSNP